MGGISLLTILRDQPTLEVSAFGHGRSLMSCTKHFLFFTWHHHHWRRAVSWAETYSSQETNMWGRPTSRDYVTCQTQYFCADCGKTKAEGYCGCDKAKADHCAVRLAWIAGAPAAELKAASRETAR